MFRQTAFACVLGALALPPLAQAQPAPASPSAAFWRSSAAMDVEAAYRELEADHPGASPAMGDAAFRASLERGHALAVERAAKVSDFPGYAATLAGFANTFGDKHVRSRPSLQAARPDWAGVIVAKQGDHWRVVDEDAGSAADSLMGSELLSCDGRTPEDWGREVMGGFRADWSVDAQKVQIAPWLLISEGNPFVGRPQACDFSTASGRRTVKLDWRPIARDSLAPRLEKASAFGAAGFGVRKAGPGYWIAIQSLDDRAAKVVEEVRAQAAALRQAPFVVLDMRGNGGGSSIFGREIAEQILGPAYVQALLGDAEGPCGEVWRISDDNLKRLEEYRTLLGPTRGAEFVTAIDKMIAQAKAAKAKGQALSGPASCPAPVKATPPPTPFKGRLYLLTDGLCFSSCLSVVSDWRDLGAVQLGRPTDANTHYSEVHDLPMPSGLSTFSTMMAVSPDAPPRLGPFTPRDTYQGDIADTAAVEAWAVAIAGRG